MSMPLLPSYPILDLWWVDVGGYKRVSLHINHIAYTALNFTKDTCNHEIQTKQEDVWGTPHGSLGPSFLLGSHTF